MIIYNRNNHNQDLRITLDFIMHKNLRVKFFRASGTNRCIISTMGDTEILLINCNYKQSNPQHSLTRVLSFSRELSKNVNRIDDGCYWKSSQFLDFITACCSVLPKN